MFFKIFMTYLLLAVLTSSVTTSLASNYGYFGSKQVQQGMPSDHVKKLKALGINKILLKVNFPIDAIGQQRLREYISASEIENIQTSLVVNLVDTEALKTPDGKTLLKNQTLGEYQRLLCPMADQVRDNIANRIRTLLTISGGSTAIDGIVLDAEWYVPLGYVGGCPGTVSDNLQATQRQIQTLLSSSLGGSASSQLGVLGYEDNWFSMGALQAALQIRSEVPVFLEQSYTVGISPNILKFLDSSRQRYPKAKFIPGFWIQQLSPSQIATEISAASTHLNNYWLFNVVSLLDPDQYLEGPYSLFYPQEDYLKVMREQGAAGAPTSIPTNTYMQGTSPSIPEGIFERFTTALDRIEVPEDIIIKSGSKRLAGLRGTNLVVVIIPEEQNLSEVKIKVTSVQISESYRDMTKILRPNGNAVGIVDFGKSAEFSIGAEYGNVVPLVIASGRNVSNVEASANDVKIVGIADDTAPLSLFKPLQQFLIASNNSVSEIKFSYVVEAPQEDAIVQSQTSTLKAVTTAENNGIRNITLSAAIPTPRLSFSTSSSVNTESQKPILVEKAITSTQESGAIVKFSRTALGVAFEDVKTIAVIGEGAFHFLIPTD